MATLEWRDEAIEVEIGLASADRTVTPDMIEEDGLSAEPGHAEAVRWFYGYRVPFPGVRYYSCEELTP